MPRDFLNDEKLRANLDLFTAWTESQLAYRGQPGIAVGLVHDQTLLWSHGFGSADVDQATPTNAQTLFRIASITKLFTSTAIVQLRDEGLLQLDDPVAKHLPWFDIRNPHDDAPPITIRHLLTHAAGLPRESAFPYWTTNEFPSNEEIRDAVASQELSLPTATSWKYSNLGLSLAGAIIEAVTGLAHSEYVGVNILEPLGMTNTFVETIDPQHPLLATGYGRRLPDLSREVAPHTDCKGISPAANMASSVEDLAKFIQLQFRSGPRQGAQILAGSSLREMHRVHWLDDDWSAGRGLGFYVYRCDGRTVVGHGGALLGYRTSMQLVPNDKIGVIVLTNADDGEPSLYVNKMFEWVVPALVEAAAEETTSVLQEGWQTYVGRYRDRWGDCQVLIYEGELTMIVPNDADPLASKTTLTPVAPHTFRMKTANHFGDNGELATFELDEFGTVTRIKTGEDYLFRIEDW